MTHKIADGVKAALPEVIGPADSWEVTVGGNQGTIIGGRVPSVVIHGVNAHVTPEMTMTTLDIDARDISVDLRKRTVKSIGSVTFQGTLNQAQLDRYLRLTDGADPNRPRQLSVGLRRNDLLIGFRYAKYGVSVPVSVAGRLSISRAGSDKIDLNPTRTAVAKVPIPSSVVDYEMKQVNPVIDLSTMKFPVTLRDIHVADGQMVFAGKTEITPDAIKVAQQQAENAK
ncbi:MAG TPA: DUF2993 domain-containing protein [Capsulimonadaceae bacterium]